MIKTQNRWKGVKIIENILYFIKLENVNVDPIQINSIKVESDRMKTFKKWGLDETSNIMCMSASYKNS